jgi:UrcA family protein
MTRYFIGAALAAMTLACGSGAFAQTSYDRQDVMVVRLSDLDTAHQSGAETALHRIKAAATKFCGDDGAKSIERRWEEERCVTRMTGKAVQSLGATEVTELFIKSGGQFEIQSGVQLADRR